MTGNVGYDDLRVDTVVQVAKLMAAAAITAPKSGGQLLLAGGGDFMGTVIVQNRDERHRIAEWLWARGMERREQIWFRDAEVATAVDAILFVGLLPEWCPPNYDCGACGYATCAEFLHFPKSLRDNSAELEFAGPVATCATSTSASPSVPPPRPPPSTPSTAAARPAPPSLPASSASSRPTTRWRSPCPLPTSHRVRPPHARHRLRRSRVRANHNAAGRR